MNKWQVIYCETYCDGKKPRTKIGKEEFELLGKVKSEVIVHFPEFNSSIASQCHGAEIRTFVVDAYECDIPNGKIDACTLASNLRLWTGRGYKIETR